MINDILDSCKRGGFRLKLDSSKETVVEGSSDNKLHSRDASTNVLCTSEKYGKIKIYDRNWFINEKGCIRLKTKDDIWEIL